MPSASSAARAGQHRGDHLACLRAGQPRGDRALLEALGHDGDQPGAAARPAPSRPRRGARGASPPRPGAPAGVEDVLLAPASARPGWPRRRSRRRGERPGWAWCGRAAAPGRGGGEPVEVPARATTDRITAPGAQAGRTRAQHRGGVLRLDRHADERRRADASSRAAAVPRRPRPRPRRRPGTASAITSRAGRRRRPRTRPATRARPIAPAPTSPMLAGQRPTVSIG